MSDKAKRYGNAILGRIMELQMVIGLCPGLSTEEQRKAMEACICLKNLTPKVIAEVERIGALQDAEAAFVMKKGGAA